MEMGLLVPIEEQSLYEIDGGITKAVAGGAAVVGAVAGFASWVSSACGASTVSAGFGAVAGIAAMVSGYCALIPAP